MNDFEFEWTKLDEVSKSVIDSFESGNKDFDDFLKEKAQLWANCGEGVTYVIVRNDQLEKKQITNIYGYVTVSSTGLLYNDQNTNRYLSCAEIRMFAIAKQLRKRHDITIQYSDNILKVILQNIYEMSTKCIGFRAICLNSNNEGYNLYKDNGFVEIKDFIAPSEEKGIDIEGTIPMLLIIDDEMIENVFL